MKWIEDYVSIVFIILVVGLLMTFSILKDNKITKLELQLQTKQDTIQVDGVKYIKMKPITLTQ